MTEVCRTDGKRVREISERGKVSISNLLNDPQVEMIKYRTNTEAYAFLGI